MEKPTMHDEPCAVEAADNAVLVKCTDDMEITLSPKAALETARHLEQAAVDSIVNRATSGAK